MDNYAISDFFMLLKLGIWKSGHVSNWGRIDKLAVLQKKDDIADLFPETDRYLSNANLVPLLRKTEEQYIQQDYAKQNLANGVYLLDFYLHTKDKDNHGTFNIFILILSISRLGFEKRDKTYVLRMTTQMDEAGFRKAVHEVKEVQRKSSHIRKRSSGKRFTSTPINAAVRKH